MPTKIHKKSLVNKDYYETILSFTNFYLVGLHHAFVRNSVMGKSGLVFGSDGKTPWVENFAIMVRGEQFLIFTVFPKFSAWSKKINDC